MKLLLINFLLLFTLSGCFKKVNDNTFNLPFDKDIEWVYISKGYKSFDLNIGTTPKFLDMTVLDDSNESVKTIEETINSYDTLNIKITDAFILEHDSALYKFNFDFVRFWGNTILKDKNGYKRFFGTDEISLYLIKFPVVKGNTWENKFSRFYEKSVITNIDTTIKINNITFLNCIRISTLQKREGREYHIETYFNQKYGLLYYLDEKSGDEIKLLNISKTQ